MAWNLKDSSGKNVMAQTPGEWFAMHKQSMAAAPPQIGEPDVSKAIVYEDMAGQVFPADAERGRPVPDINTEDTIVFYKKTGQIIHLWTLRTEKYIGYMEETNEGNGTLVGITNMQDKFRGTFHLRKGGPVAVKSEWEEKGKKKEGDESVNLYYEGARRHRRTHRRRSTTRRHRKQKLSRRRR